MGIIELLKMTSFHCHLFSLSGYRAEWYSKGHEFKSGDLWKKMEKTQEYFVNLTLLWILGKLYHY